MEEPTLSSNFCFPQSEQYARAINLLFKLGETFGHDYDIGLKLIHKIKPMKMLMKNISFSQPVLFNCEQKAILRLSLKAASEKFTKANLITKNEFETLMADIEALEVNENYVFTLSRQTQIVATK